MKYVRVATLLVVLGCSSTGVVPMDNGTYMIAKRSAQAGFGPPVAAKAQVYREANAFCARQGKTVETVNLELTDSGFARPGSVTLEFRCK
jgi:hypothetical protein